MSPEPSSEEQMKSFKEFIGHDDDVIIERIEGPARVATSTEIGVVSIWSLRPDVEGLSLLVEAIGNKKVHLIGQYSVRYDPPRTASTGVGAKLKGDWHLFDKSGEALAWDTDGNARHGYPSGSKVPKKAYQALRARYGELSGLKSRILESIELELASARDADDLADAIAAELIATLTEVSELPGVYDAVLAAIKRAMLLERLACAQVAEDFAPRKSANQPDLDLGQAGALMGLKGAAHTIADNIRQRSRSG